jgi:hypothetical protein
MFLRLAEVQLRCMYNATIHLTKMVVRVNRTWHLGYLE